MYQVILRDNNIENIKNHCTRPCQCLSLSGQKNNDAGWRVSHLFQKWPMTKMTPKIVEAWFGGNLLFDFYI